MDTALSLVELTAYLVAILGLSMSVTWAVVRISPSESAREQRAQAKEQRAQTKGEAKT